MQRVPAVLCMRRILDLFSLRTDLRVDSTRRARGDCARGGSANRKRAHERALVERSSQTPRCRFHAKDARAHADRALRLASAEEVCRTARDLGPAGESGHDAAPRSLRRASALYDRGETAERHVARAAVGILPGRRIGAGDLRVSANLLLLADDRARERGGADTVRATGRPASSGQSRRPAVSAPAAPRPAAVQKPIVASSRAAAGPTKKTKTLAEQLLDEAREVQLARSGKKRAPEQSGSWLTRLLGRTHERPRSPGRR